MKRLMDFIVASIVLILLLPIILILCAIVRMNLGSPVFFRQLRPGLYGHPFELWKFRTMRNAVGVDGSPLPDAERLGRFGRLLRSSSLDELPSLWNVLCGDMSVVGPRPLLMQYLPLYTLEQARRHEVRPGITGWAQVNGRNAVTWEDRLSRDKWYVDHRSLRLDLKIIAMTIGKVLRREGVSAVNEATMSEFKGVPSISKLAAKQNVMDR